MKYFFTAVYLQLIKLNTRFLTEDLMKQDVCGGYFITNQLYGLSLNMALCRPTGRVVYGDTMLQPVHL